MGLSNSTLILVGVPPIKRAVMWVFDPDAPYRTPYWLALLSLFVPMLTIGYFLMFFILAFGQWIFVIAMSLIGLFPTLAVLGAASRWAPRLERPIKYRRLGAIVLAGLLTGGWLVTYLFSGHTDAATRQMGVYTWAIVSSTALAILLLLWARYFFFDVGPRFVRLARMMGYPC